MEKSKAYDTAAILSYVYILGWIIAIFIYKKNKTEFAAYHLKQALGLHITFHLLLLFGTVSRILSLLIVIFTIIGFIYAIQGDKKPVPVLGDLYQSLFKGIG